MTKQVVKYESTTVPVERTLSELVTILRRYGCRSFAQQWDEEGRTTGIRFVMEVDGKPLPVRMNARDGEIQSRLLARPKYRRDPIARADQAERIAWRHLKDFMEQVLVAVDLGLSELGEALMAHVVVLDEDGYETTAGQEFAKRLHGGQLLLPEAT